MNHIFSGVKIIDFTKAYSGPFATRNFADYGAEVIKIESEDNYDATRNFPPLKNDWSRYFEILNRNKKSLNLNLNLEKDLNAFYQLIKNADVFVENSSPETKHKLKISYQILKKHNPKIIYASLSGIGQQSNRKYYDVIAQAESGLMSLTGYPQEPLKIAPSIVDAFSGMTLAFAISSALFYRSQTGKGQYLEASMLAASMNLLEANLIDYSITRQIPPRVGNQDNAIAPFGVYKTKDSYVALAAGSAKLWTTLVQFLKSHHSFNDEMFATNQLRIEHQMQLTKVIETVLSQFTSHQIQKKMDLIGIPCGQVFSMKEVFENKDLYKNNALIKVNHPELGQCVVPGFAVNFSAMKNLTIKMAPKISSNHGI